MTSYTDSAPCNCNSGGGGGGGSDGEITRQDYNITIPGSPTPSFFKAAIFRQGRKRWINGNVYINPPVDGTTMTLMEIDSIDVPSGGVMGTLWTLSARSIKALVGAYLTGNGLYVQFDSIPPAGLDVSIAGAWLVDEA